MLSLLLPCRNLLHFLRVIDSKVLYWKALNSPCHRMRGGGGVCNALQSAIFTPLTLVQHFLFTAAVWAILGVMKTNNCESDMDPSTLSGNRDKGRWLTWGILQEGFLLTVELSFNELYIFSELSKNLAAMRENFLLWDFFSQWNEIWHVVIGGSAQIKSMLLCHLLLFLAPLFWSSLPATTVGRTCFDLDQEWIQLSTVCFDFKTNMYSCSQSDNCPLIEFLPELLLFYLVVSYFCFFCSFPAPWVEFWRGRVNFKVFNLSVLQTIQPQSLWISMSNIWEERDSSNPPAKQTQGKI